VLSSENFKEASPCHRKINHPLPFQFKKSAVAFAIDLVFFSLWHFTLFRLNEIPPIALIILV
jgi:hypothetical protein